MKNKILVILLGLIFVIGLIGINIFLEFENDKRMSINNIENSNEIVIPNNEVLTENNLTENITNIEVSNENINNEVLEVTEDTFEKEVLLSDKPVLIDFYADWCMPCKRQAPIIENLAKEMQDIKFVKIDVDNNYNLAYEYRASSIPLLVIIKDGKVVKRNVGLTSEAVLKSILEEVK